MFNRTLRTCLLLAFAAMLAVFAWQAPLALELQSRARWLADAQRAVTMLSGNDLREWFSLDPEGANAVITVFHVMDGLWSPEAQTERERRSLLFGALITRGPALPPELDVGVGARNAPQMVDPASYMLRAAMTGLWRTLAVLIVVVVVIPALARATWVLYVGRTQRLNIAPPFPSPPWLLLVIVPALALVLSWGWFDRTNLWGATVPGWREASVIGITTFALVVLPRLIITLLAARDRAASTDGRCPTCFYGPFANPNSPNTPQRCPECGIDTGKPPPHRLLQQRIALWTPRLALVAFLTVACWWPIRIIGPYLFTHGFSRPAIPGYPQTTMDTYLARWIRMQQFPSLRDPSTGQLDLAWMAVPFGAGQDLSHPSTPVPPPNPAPPP
jgi:hypothetical protein